MPLILGTNSIKDTGFDVANSLRFNSGSSDFLNRTPSSASNRKTFTISFWTKICKFDTTGYTIIGAGNSSSGEDGELVLKIDNFGSDGQLILQTGATVIFETTQVLRDVSAWYHIVVSVDTSNGTSGNRVRLYINGSEVSNFDVENQPSVNQDFAINNNVVHEIGRFPRITDQEFDGYLAEFVFIDGQQLAPTSFGEFDDDSGIWKPKAVSGLTFGTNGFYLDFEDSSALGNDKAGSNNFTVNNLTAIDQSTDTCTNNFATMNPLDNFYQGATFSDGNLTVTTTNSSQSYSTSSIMVSSGKWYVECKPVSGGSEPEIGVAYKMVGVGNGNNAQLSYNANGYGYRASNPGNIWYNGSAISTNFATYSNGNIIGIALDLDNNKLYFSVNGTFGNSGDPTSGATGTGAISIVDPASTDMGVYAFAMNENFNDQNKVFSWNFGSPPYSESGGNSDADGHGNFKTTPPSGYFALCSKNLAEYG